MTRHEALARLWDLQYAGLVGRTTVLEPTRPPRGVTIEDWGAILAAFRPPSMSPDEYMIYVPVYGAGVYGLRRVVI